MLKRLQNLEGDITQQYVEGSYLTAQEFNKVPSKINEIVTYINTTNTKVEVLEDNVATLMYNGGGGQGGTIFPTEVEWSNVKNKPTEFPPASHMHEISDIDGLENRLTQMSDDIEEISQNSYTQPVPTGDGIGIPVLDKEIMDSLDVLPEKYITVPTPDELEQEIDDPIQYQNTGNGYYLDILFSSIRKLQSEVAMLRNSFRYGIYSYNDTDTAMSTIVNDYGESVDNEPLWATEETDLSELDSGLYITGIDNGLTGDFTLDGVDKLNITHARWQDDMVELLNEPMKSCEDPKQYIFMTLSSTNVKIELKKIDSEGTLTIDLSQFNITPTSSGKYNILFILSRSVEENPETYNFVWLSIADYVTGVATTEGYLNPSTHTTSATRTLIGGPQDRYYIYAVEFDNLLLYKYNTYSKKQDFSNNVIPAPAATDENYKYSAAHITIRSVKSLSVLEEIKNQLKKNELIYIENINTLYIKTDNGVKPISGGSDTNIDTNTGMEKQEIIDWLAKNGIIVTDNGGELKLNDVSEITLIHEGSGKSFKYTTDAEGNLRSNEIREDTLEERLAKSGISVASNDANNNIRGLVGMLGEAEAGKAPNQTGDIGLRSDRVKIGSMYCPRENQKSWGCSHAYVELENTSDRDFQLDGCYLYYATADVVDDVQGPITMYKLALDGRIPAGGTYLIRAKQYSDFDAANTFIDVKTYDKEWWQDGELVPLTRHTRNTFLLVYGETSINTTMYGTVTINSKAYTGFNPHYIDSTSIGAAIVPEGASKSTWDQQKVNYTNPDYDAILKINYSLDPAKQAYQSLMSDTKDSSRVRGANATDYQIVDLRVEYIEFPATTAKLFLSNYTPRASFEHKNVCTDKTQLDINRPNMVTCSFGNDIFKRRCFNWVSAGVFDEFLWVRKKGTDTWQSIESYKEGAEITSPLNPICFTPVNYDSNQRTYIYNRLIDKLPASELVYTSHKMVIDLDQTKFNNYKSSENDGESSTWEKTVYEYVVGRADKNGNPDPEHTSDIQEFTIYPPHYKMRIYQHTDQQGFQWIEYQAWAAAAEKMLEVIEYDLEHEPEIIPVLINTGDMTQNGTRINEWLDFYNGGKCLFSKFEQLAVVGNNDLCDTNINKLGTGDDVGKSNGYYFHVAFCFDVTGFQQLYVNGKYMPSTYVVKSRDHAIVCIDSEFTAVNCEQWFNLMYQGQPVNIYTGWTMASAANETHVPVYAASHMDEFIPLYDQLYALFDNLINTEGYSPENIICACHEMPFTVVTNANLSSTDWNNAEKGVINRDRSINNGTALVGSHMNRMSYRDATGIYWFSRLLEYFGIKLVIGGHKHTYVCTNPLRENYFYMDGDVEKSSLNDGPMAMQPTLENDDKVSWNHIMDSTNGDAMVHTTKFPIMDATKTSLTPDKINIGTSQFYPVWPASSDTFANNRVIYFMLQATGFKLKSNKELPSNSQLFGYIIPKTKHESPTSDKPYADQQYPMFAKIDLDNRYIVLCRVDHILSNKTLTQQEFGNGKMTVDCAMRYTTNSDNEQVDNGIYGSWIKNIAIGNLNNYKLISF